MNPIKKHGRDSGPSGGEKKSTAESESTLASPEAGTDDWRKQQEPKPTPPKPTPIPPAGPAPAKQKSQVTSAPAGRAMTPPGTAGTPITVTPYTSNGVRFFMVGTVLVGSEGAACESLKNQLTLPSIAS